MFQSSPSPKAGSYRSGSGVAVYRQVSILSQPEGRELLTPSHRFPAHSLFQSSPSPKAGSYFLILGLMEPVNLFQSSPSPKAGSYRSRCLINSVSVQFQSSPSPKAGSYN